LERSHEPPESQPPKEHEMTDTEQLIASLTTTNPDVDGVQFDDGRYFDWSTRTDDGVEFQAGTEAEAAVVDMSRDDVVRLQRALTLWLLQNPA
jgi:uncharacterized lipoprotein YddW (UPF0748 family)